MRVAISFPGIHRRGGVERVAFECARFLSGRQHEVTLVAGEWEEISSPHIHYAPVKFASHPFYLRGRNYFRSASRLVQGMDFDVLNSHGSVCPTGGVHWVQSVHAAWLEKSRQMRPLLSVARLRQAVNPLHRQLLDLEHIHFSRRAYRKLIVTTHDVWKDLYRFYGVPETDVEIIPNGFAPAEFNPENRARRRNEVRLGLGLGPEHFVWLFVANELERKGYRSVLDAMRLLRDKRIKLVVIGRGVEKQARELAADLDKQVLVLGSSKDVAGMHAAADLFVLPTQYEAFSLAILESLGSGLPVITSDVPGARNAIQPGQNGYIMRDPRDGAELAEIMRPLLDHDALRALSNTTPATVETYQWPQVLQRYEAVLLNRDTS